MPYQIGGRPVQLPDEPRNLNGPVYAPLRQVIEALGGKATWDGPSDTAGATLNGRHARIPVGSTDITVDGQPVTMSVPTFQDGGTVWVPIEIFDKAFGVTAYADATNTVSIDTANLRNVA
jgi:hypothetical protein